MAQKDIAQKLLEDYEDVFADIVNVLVFEGKDVVHPDSLEASNIRSQYKAASDGMTYTKIGRYVLCTPASELPGIRALCL